MKKQNRTSAGLVAVFTLTLGLAADAQEIRAPYAVDGDGNVLLALKAEGQLIRVDRDGNAQVIAEALDGPDAVRVSADGSILISDRSGVQSLQAGSNTLQQVSKASRQPVYFVKLLQPRLIDWTHLGDPLTIAFVHNLPASKAHFNVEVSSDGGGEWTTIRSKLRKDQFTWQATGEHNDRVIFRVSGVIRGHEVASDVSDAELRLVAHPR